MAQQLKVNKNNGFWAQMRRLPRAWVGAALVGFVVVCAVFAPVFSPADPLEQFRDGLTEFGTPRPPDSQFLFGTDNLGRDILSRMLFGARVSLFISLAANMTAMVLGTTVGMLAGYFSGAVDYILMRFTDIIMAFPPILLALGLTAILRPSVSVVIVVLTVLTWPPLARLARSQALSVRERDFVLCARSLGASDVYILLRHILPHILTVSVVWVTLTFATTVLLEAGLSFLGVGVPLPEASWGNIIAEGQQRYRTEPWIIFIPTMAILLTTLGFNLLGDAVRDALDPRTSQRA